MPKSTELSIQKPIHHLYWNSICHRHIPKPPRTRYQNVWQTYSTITKLLLKSQTGQSCRNLDEPFVWKFASSRKLCSGNRYWRWMKLECEESEESSLDWREITERAGNITLIPYKLVKQNQDIFPNCLWSLIWLKCKVQCIFLTKVNQKIIQYKLEWKTGLNQSTYI